jgi:hypothetical protein
VKAAPSASADTDKANLNAMPASVCVLVAAGCGFPAK